MFSDTLTTFKHPAVIQTSLPLTAVTPGPPERLVALLHPHPLSLLY